MPFTKDDVGPRLVDDRVVVLSDGEREAIAAQWNAETAKPPRLPELTLGELIAVLEAAASAEVKAAIAAKREEKRG
ncbi:MAG: hypothetical protein FJX56_08850 [Alphaproteobacteria bacterium]|nr:hypothetical protein [Alphaproteobacteria bacterium]